MNRPRFVLKGFLLLILGILLSGCASTPPTRLFVLSALPGAEKTANPGTEPCFALGIGPVRIPTHMSQPQILTRVSPNELRADEFAKWAEPLDENILRVLAENLESLLCVRAMTLFPRKGQVPTDYRIEVSVVRMDGVLGENASLEVVWTIADGKDRKKPPLEIKRKHYKESTKGADYSAFVAAESRNLEALSADIAAAIKSLPR